VDDAPAFSGLLFHLQAHPLPEHIELELELELIQTHMTQKPMLRVEVGARALRGRSSVRGGGASAVLRALAGSTQSQRPVEATSGRQLSFCGAPPRGLLCKAPLSRGRWRGAVGCAPLETGGS
jgi:hypothetical protein